MSQNTSCLNCDEPVFQKFCPNCGQKTNTHRITLKHFFLHDIVHGVWHMEKGILFTLKEALLQPGKAALDYISGKRIRYYNVFYLILLFVGLTILVENLNNFLYEKYPYPYSDASIDNESLVVLNFLSEHLKLFMALAIPVFAFNSYCLFRKKKLYYSEHLILFGMLYLGVIVINLIGYLLNLSEYVEPLTFIRTISEFLAPILTAIYLFNGLYGAFGKDYKLSSFIFRVLLYLILIIIEMRLLGTILKAVLN
jgi:hypothetical protein